MESKATFKLNGINLSENQFVLASTYLNIGDIRFERLGSELYSVTFALDGTDADHNYLRALDVMDHCRNLMLMVGKRVNVEGELEIEPRPSLLAGKLIVGIPIQAPGADEVKELAGKFSSAFSNLTDEEKKELRALFDDFAEAQRELAMPHKFRSAFSVFNNLVDKFGYMNGISINYKSDLQGHFVDMVTERYKGPYYIRFRDLCDKLIAENLADHFDPSKDFSQGLQNALSSLAAGVLLDEKVAFYAMKCVQQIRNKVNHGDYRFVNYASINVAYELILMLSQHLLRKRIELLSVAAAPIATETGIDGA